MFDMPHCKSLEARKSTEKHPNAMRATIKYVTYWQLPQFLTSFYPKESIRICDANDGQFVATGNVNYIVVGTPIWWHPFHHGAYGYFNWNGLLVRIYMRRFTMIFICNLIDSYTTP